MVPPAVTDFDPAPGQTITKNEPLAFTISDASGIPRVFVSVRYPETGLEEVAYDGLAFAPFYDTSTRQPLAGPEPSFRFTLRRGGGGWPSSPLVKVDGVDGNGNPV